MPTLTALLRTGTLLAMTAVAEILGCYLPWLWLRRGAPGWYVLPAGVCLAVFAWLLTLHPTGAGRTYAAYGGVYVTVALVWLWVVEGQRPTATDIVGVTLTLAGMAVITLGARTSH